MGEANGVDNLNAAVHVPAREKQRGVFAEAVHEVAGVGGVVAEGEVDGFAQFRDGVIDEAGVDVDVVDAGFAGVLAGVIGQAKGVVGPFDVPEGAATLADVAGFVVVAHVADDDALGVGVQGDLAAVEDVDPEIGAVQLPAPFGAEGLGQVAIADAQVGDDFLLLGVHVVAVDAEDGKHVADRVGVGHAGVAVAFDEVAGDGVLAGAGAAGDADEGGVGHSG